MASTSFHLGFFLLFLTFSNVVTSLSSFPKINPQQLGRRELLAGGKTEIGNVKSNKEVQDLGQFAVDEFNKNHQPHLVFSDVVKAESQVVAGMKYYLTIDAIDNGVHKSYDAVVVVQDWRNSKELLSFTPSTK